MVQLEPPRGRSIQLKEAVLIYTPNQAGNAAIPGAIIEILPDRIKVRSPRPLPHGTPVRVQGMNILMSGEVQVAEAVGDGFTLELKATRPIADLDRFHRRIMSEATRS